MNSYQSLLAQVMDLEVVDTHEHLPPREADRDHPTDILYEYTMHYFSKDLVSAGLPKDGLLALRDVKRPLAERWNAVEPYWEASRFTGYGRALDTSAKLLYGLPVNRETLETVNERFMESLNPGHFSRVLKGIVKARTSLLDCGNSLADWYDKSLFTPVWRLDGYVLPSGEGMNRLERDAKTRIRSLTDYVEAIGEQMRMACGAGYAAFKVGLAYSRSLHFERTVFADAERGFIDAMNAMKNGAEWGSIFFDKRVQDYVMHHCLRVAETLRMPVQIHTGLLESNGKLLANSDPILLSNLFNDYDVDFDLFHIGYPFWQTLSALAKNYPHVFIDMCWAHIISPEMSVRALSEWIDSVPLTKICGFGGDYRIIDAVAGHAIMARENISRALAGKIDLGVMDESEALSAARRILFDNPARIFGV